MQTYNLQIDENQREMIAAALREYAYPACFEKDDKEELDILTTMFENLPKEELDSPNCTHGFCL